MATLTSKRKRDDHDLGGMRAPPTMHNDYHNYMQADPNQVHFADMLAQHAADNPGTVEDENNGEDDPARDPSGQQGGLQASDTAAAAMAQYHNMTIPVPTEQTFMAQNPEIPQDRQGSTSGEAAGRTSNFGEFDPSGGRRDTDKEQEGDESPTSASRLNATPGGSKPSVGSDEWHKVRRDNHKEVERRRRETINEGINELAKIVPGCEKNKGSILARAVQFITQLKENETQNIEKWTLEKLLTEQAIAELSSTCDRLKADCLRARKEVEIWKKRGAEGGDAGEGDDAKADVEG
ncbi:hypothetical protein LTR62_008804 [Meristemomyces frigidus]|uniref:BHLH domain-containing protein n=1 Tax=Meristemomyces frigidus TaxID=1508187 RepID=A0AAN7TAI6_9PEZI|nr:hypothetical protein LTR62_008804 [Meristemomyces frigidus]